MLIALELVLPDHSLGDQHTEDERIGWEDREVRVEFLDTS